MKTSLLSEVTPPFQEGLPYWMLWLLLGVIVLLVFFIFLRDKDLRRRIDFFFLSARNRSLQLHLERQIKREKRRKEALWEEVGRLIYMNRLSLPGTEALFQAIDALEEKRKHLETEMKVLEENLARLETSKRPPQPAEAGETTEASGESATARKENLVFWDETRETRAEAGSWKRRLVKVKEKIRDLEDHERAYFTTLGRIGDTLRPADEALQILFDKIDQINLRISHIEQRLDSLHPF